MTMSVLGPDTDIERGGVAQRRGVAGMAAFLIAYFLVGLATLNDQHEWGGDFALYLSQARALVESGSLLDPYFVHNPKSLWHSPINYPPVYPAMLAPFVAGFGLDLQVLKAPAWLAQCVSLLGLLLLIARLRSRETALATVLVFALNPFVWAYRQQIMSEFPFILISVFALYAALLRENAKPRTLVLHSMVTGALIFIAFETRSIGIVLLIAVLLHDLMRIADRTVAIKAGVTLATFAVLLGVYQAGVRDVGYDDSSVGICLRCAARNVASYYKSLNYLILDSFRIAGSKTVGYLVGLLACALTALGLGGAIVANYRAQAGGTARWRKAARSLSPMELYLGGSLILLAILPFTYAPRSLLPLLPFGAFYLVHGIRAALSRVTARAGTWRWAVAGVLCVYLLGHWGPPWLATPYRAAIGAASPETRRLYDAVARNVGPRDLIMVGKPRVFSLFTRRRATRWGSDVTPETLLADVRARGVTHLIAGKPGSFLRTRGWMLDHGVVAANFTVVYEDALFRMWKFTGGPGR